MGTTFDSVTIVYNNTGPQYDITYSLTTDASNFGVGPLINNQFITFAMNQSNGTFTVDEASYPEFFTQGATINTYVQFFDFDTFTQLDSSNIYSVFQRRTDAYNISINGNTKYVYAFTDTNHIKSVILPPISQSGFCTFFFKFLGQQKPASFCPYMSNTSYPIDESVLIATDSSYSGIFDAKLQEKFQSRIFQVNSSNRCFSIFNNNSNWYYSSDYNPSQTLIPSYGSQQNTDGALLDSSNNQILYYEYVDRSTIVMCNSPASSFPKYVFFRRPQIGDPNPLTVRIFAPPNVSIDSTTPNTGDSAFVSFDINENQQCTMGFFYNPTANQYYVLSYYDSAGLTSSNVTSGFTTLSNSFGIIYDKNSDVRLSLPVQQLGYAKINTIAFIGAETPTPRTVTLTAPSGANSIILPNGPSISAILGNTQGNVTYTFASYFKSATSTCMTIPLYSSPV